MIAIEKQQTLQGLQELIKLLEKNKPENPGPRPNPFEYDRQDHEFMEATKEWMCKSGQMAGWKMEKQSVDHTLRILKKYML